MDTLSTREKKSQPLENIKLSLGTCETVSASEQCPCGEKLDTILNSGEGARYCSVNFRELVKCFKYGERVTHSIHPYPAKLLPHIPHFFLSHPDISPDNATVGDPFCGSGTVMLESALLGRTSWGYDCNPLATLISKVKTTPIEPRRITHALSRIKANASKIRNPRKPDVANLEYWFHRSTVPQLSAIAEVVRKMRAPDLKSFFQIALSLTARRLSLADPRIPVPVLFSPDKYPKRHWLHQYYQKRLTYIKTAHPLVDFSTVVTRNAHRNQRLWEVRDDLGTVNILNHDTKSAFLISDSPTTGQNTQLIITSPPYGSAQKYTRSTKLSLGWLSLWESHRLQELDRVTIGREHYQVSQVKELPQTGLPEADAQMTKYFLSAPTRCVALANYCLEMRIAVRRVFDAITEGGHLVLIMGDNTLRGELFPTSRYIMNICEDSGFRTRAILTDGIKSRGLITRRHVTSGIIENEKIMIFRKGNE